MRLKYPRRGPGIPVSGLLPPHRLDDGYGGDGWSGTEDDESVDSEWYEDRDEWSDGSRYD